MPCFCPKLTEKLKYLVSKLTTIHWRSPHSVLGAIDPERSSVLEAREIPEAKTYKYIRFFSDCRRCFAENKIKWFAGHWQRCSPRGLFGLEERGEDFLMWHRFSWDLKWEERVIWKSQRRAFQEAKYEKPLRHKKQEYPEMQWNWKRR